MTQQTRSLNYILELFESGYKYLQIEKKFKEEFDAQTFNKCFETAFNRYKDFQMSRIDKLYFE